MDEVKIQRAQDISHQKNIYRGVIVNLNAFCIVLFCMFLLRKCIVIVGGYAAAYVPETNYYCALLSPLGRFRVVLLFL